VRGGLCVPVNAERSRWGHSLAGIGGVAPHDNPQAYRWERRLHWVMIVVALAALPSVLIDEFAVDPALRGLGRALDLLIFAAFATELAWMLRTVTHKRRYLLRNWLDVLIIVAAAVSVTGYDTEWVALARLARLALVGLMLARFLGSLRTLFTPDALPAVLGVAAVCLLIGGAGFYWLEPTVHSYADGLWLAFVTGATVGYGDMVPTSSAARVWAVVMVLLGFAVLSMLTATLVTMFLGEDEAKLRRELHHDIRTLRDEVRTLRAEIAAARAADAAPERSDHRAGSAEGGSRNHDDASR
jgi:voltage-gated potassium channel